MEDPKTLDRELFNNEDPRPDEEDDEIAEESCWLALKIPVITSGFDLVTGDTVKVAFEYDWSPSGLARTVRVVEKIEPLAIKSCEQRNDFEPKNTS